MVTVTSASRTTSTRASPISKGITVGPPQGPFGINFKGPGQGLLAGPFGITSSFARNLSGRNATVNSILAALRLT